MRREEKREGEERGRCGAATGLLLSLLGWAGWPVSKFFLTKLSSFLFSVFKTKFKKQGKTFYKNLEKYFLESFSNIEYYGTYLATKIH